MTPGSQSARPASSWSVVLLNFVLFQAAWFACVAAAARGHDLLGSLVIAVVVGIHLSRAQRWVEEAKLIGCAMLIGVVWDTLMASTGLLVYPPGVAPTAPGSSLLIAPVWIVAMWALLATTLNVSMTWLKGRPALATLMGAIAGPLSFLAGARMGALDFGRTVATPLTLAAGWALMMPVLLSLAERFNGIRDDRSGALCPSGAR